MSTETKAPDYIGMAHEEIAEMNGKRGLVAAELEACEAELMMLRGELPGVGRTGPDRGALALDAILGDGRRRKVDEARRRVVEAREVSGLVWAMRHGGRNAGDVYALQSYGDVAERLTGSRG